MRCVQADDDVVAVEGDRVLPYAEALVDRAPAGRDVELPLVPWAPHDAVGFADRELAALDPDRCCDSSGAEWRSAMRAAVGERVDGVPDPVEPDAVRADLDDTYLLPAEGARLEGSALRALSCRSSRRKSEELERVLRADGVTPFLGQLSKRLLRLVEVPVREVACVHQRVPWPKPGDRRRQKLRVLGAFERL